MRKTHVSVRLCGGVAIILIVYVLVSLSVCSCPCPYLRACAFGVSVWLGGWVGGSVSVSVFVSGVCERERECTRTSVIICVGVQVRVHVNTACQGSPR